MSKLNSKWKLRNTAVLRNDVQQSEQFLCAQTGKLKLKKISVTFIFSPGSQNLEEHLIGRRQCFNGSVDMYKLW